MTIEGNGGNEIAAVDEALAVNQSGGGELAHHGRGHQGPWLHPEVGLHFPIDAIQSEMDDRIGILQSAISSEVERSLGAETIGTRPSGFRDHGRFVVVMQVHGGMDEEARLAGFDVIETESAAIGIDVAVAKGPFGRIAFMEAREIAVTVNEISGGVAPFLERAEDFGAGGGPIAGADEAFEAERAEERDGFTIESGLGVEEELGRILVARGAFIGDVP